MKKLFLMLAFTGMVTAVSASTVSALTNTSIVSVIGDDKKGDDKGKKKKSCSKDEKSCCKKDESGKKSCCKSKEEKKEEPKKGGKKKLKKRLKALKKEHKKLQHFLNTFASQQKTVQSTPVWWQDALIKTLPKVIDMGTVVFNNITQPRPQVMPAKS